MSKTKKWQGIDYECTCIRNYDTCEICEACKLMIGAERLLEKCKDKLTLAKGALAAQDKMQNEQLDKWRKQLNIPEHIVAASDVVDDLCECFANQLDKAVLKDKEGGKQ